MKTALFILHQKTSEAGNIGNKLKKSDADKIIMDARKIWFKDEENSKKDDKFLRIVKNITSKGFIRSNYEQKLVDLSDVRINLKSKN